MPSTLPDTILRTIQAACRVTISVETGTAPDGGEFCRITAYGAGGQRWTAEHHDRYRAAVLLAEMMGFELEEG
jgi:hypothetical protein